MQGLRTQENNKFVEFFKLVQKEAEANNSVFFLESGDGREFETSTLEGEDLQGWLIPKNKSEEFQIQWLKETVDEKWNEHFCFAIWQSKGGMITIKFEQYEDIE